MNGNAINTLLPAGLSKIEKTKVRKQLKTSIFRLAGNGVAYTQGFYVSAPMNYERENNL